MALQSSKAIEEVADSRAFDATVVRAALAYYNGIFAERAGPLDYPSLAKIAFADIPPLVHTRARVAGIDAALFAWRDAPESQLVAAGSALLPLNLAMFPLVRRTTVKWKGRHLSLVAWINDILATVPIYTRYHIADGGVRRMSVPILTDAPRCAAYALGILLSGEHGLSKHIRPCAYLANGFDGNPAKAPDAHYFLAAGPNGEPPKGAPQRFCCQSHSGRYRQRQFRKRHAR